MDQGTEARDVRDRLQAHDREIAALRTDIAGVQSTVVHLEKQTGLIDRKIDRQSEESRHRFDEIISALNRTGRTTLDDLVKWLQIAVYGTALVAGVVSGIVYIAGNSSASELTLLRYKMERLYGSFGWEPTVKGPPSRTHE